MKTVTVSLTCMLASTFCSATAVTRAIKLSIDSGSCKAASWLTSLFSIIPSEQAMLWPDAWISLACIDPEYPPHRKEQGTALVHCNCPSAPNMKAARQNNTAHGSDPLQELMLVY